MAFLLPDIYWLCVGKTGHSSGSHAIKKLENWNQFMLRCDHTKDLIGKIFIFILTWR